MIPAYSYEIICKELGRAFHGPSKSGIRIIGLLFARPESTLAACQIVPNLDYFHHISGNHTDFFCGGYGQNWERSCDEFPDHHFVSAGENANWLFSPSKFDRLRTEIEKRTKWRYSGGCDLLLLNGRYDTGRKSGCLDFSTVMICQLDHMRKSGAIVYAKSFFEDIFRSAERAGDNTPTQDLNEGMAKNFVASVIKNLILSSIRRAPDDDAACSTHFPILDIGMTHNFSM